MQKYIFLELNAQNDESLVLELSFSFSYPTLEIFFNVEIKKKVSQIKQCNTCTYVLQNADLARLYKTTNILLS